jgi:hypothetical protein
VSNKSKIRLAEAGKRVVRARYGKEWIGRLTQEEEFLIKRYGPQHTPASLLPGGITTITSRALSLSRPLREKLDHALFRKEWMYEQSEWFDQWFKDHGFDPDDDEIDHDAFERAFAKSFPDAAPKHVGAVADVSVPARRTRREREPAVQEAKELWPPIGHAPPELTRAEARRQLGNALKKRFPKREFKPDTLDRATGRKIDCPRKPK